MRIILPALSCKGFIYIHNEDIIGTSVREGDAGQILQGLSTHSPNGYAAASAALCAVDGCRAKLPDIWLTEHLCCIM